MLNSTTLEVAIGMALIYLVLSLFCTAINEAIAGILSSRAKNLERGIQSLFTGGLKSQAKDGTPAVTLAEAIYGHGLIQSLYRSTSSEKSAIWGKSFGSNLPSYIPSRVFASALLDIIFPAASTGSAGAIAPGNPAQSGQAPAMPADLPGMLASLETLPESKGKEAIVTLVKQAGGDIAKTRQAIENWYDDGMDRAAGWYKRRTQVILFIIGMVIALGLNVDSIALGRELWISPAVRSYTVTTAEQYAQQNSKTHPSATAAQDLATLNSLALPLGWTKSNNPLKLPILSLFVVIVGWFLTAIAMTLGAPFWFDTLNRIMVIRSTIKPGEKDSN